jgi:hypothetical protein
MQKSTIVATCLVNSKMIDKVENAEIAVQNIFQEEFPKSNFREWNIDINDQAARNIINSVGGASRINVRNFIEDLSNEKIQGDIR